MSKEIERTRQEIKEIEESIKKGEKSKSIETPPIERERIFPLLGKRQYKAICKAVDDLDIAYVGLESAISIKKGEEIEQMLSDRGLSTGHLADLIEALKNEFECE